MDHGILGDNTLRVTVDECAMRKHNSACMPTCNILQPLQTCVVTLSDDECIRQSNLAYALSWHASAIKGVMHAR